MGVRDEIVLPRSLAATRAKERPTASLCGPAVVIAIIGVLMPFLLPHPGRREAARRKQCMNHQNRSAWQS